MSSPTGKALILLLTLMACKAEQNVDATAAPKNPGDDDAGGGDDDADDPPLLPVVVLPLGETLFFDGDDYIAELGADAGCLPVIEAAPDGATATIQADQRLTPDLTGSWTVSCGTWSTELQVASDTLTADTFMNYNYTPVVPVATLGDSQLAVACPTSNAVQLVSLGDAPATG